MEFIAGLITDAPVWLQALIGLVVAAVPIATLTPTKVDDNILAGAGKILNLLLKGVNLLAGNFFLAKNADDK